MKAPLVAVLQILFGCGFTVAAACALGRWFLLRTGAWAHLGRGERLVFAFGVGAAWLSNAVFLLCAAQLAYPAVFLVVGLTLLWLGLRGRAERDKFVPATESWRPLGLLLAPVALCYAYLYLIQALAPEISPDGAGYHLGLTGRYLRERGFSRVTTNLYATLSQGLEMLFLFGYAFGRHSAAKMIHFAFLVATAGAMLCFGRRFGLAPAAAAAAVFYACSPVVGVDGTSAYNDCALAFYLFLTFYLLLLWDQQRLPWVWPALGVAAGFCYAIKYTGFLAVPAALFVAWRAGRRAALRVAGFAALFVAPWMIKNAVIVDNPVAPFFNRFFPNPYFHVSFERLYGYYMRHYAGLGENNWADYLEFPWELAVKGGKLPGLLGPLFLLAPLGLWALRDKIGRRLWAAALLCALPFLANIGTRFLIPSLVFVSLAMAAALFRLPRRAALFAGLALALGHAIGSWPSVISRWNKQPGWRLGPPPWNAALRLESEAEYLSRELPDYNLGRLIDTFVPPRAKVFAPAALAEAYTSRDVLVSYQSALGEVLMDHLLTPVVPDFAPVWTLRFDWPAAELTALRLEQTGSDWRQMWSVHELVLYAGGQRVPVQTNWILRARPNPWDAALAVDNNPATRWRSWWPLEAGMWFQLDFPQPLGLSALEVFCSSDQDRLGLELHARDAAGRWSRLPAQMTRADRDPVRHPMKRLATRQLKARGVDYLLTDVRGEGMNLIGPEIEKDRQAWGLREVGTYGPARLYYIE